jgi:beta-carotene hydroxylase
MATDTRLPRIGEFASDLTCISTARRAFSLALPFVWIALYFLFAMLRWWPLAVLALVCLSFVTYGSISHDLVHGNLGLSRRANDFFLTVIELLCRRSGRAYRLAHLYHHAQYPDPDDIEGAAADMSLARALWEGVIFQPKIWLWAVRQRTNERGVILAEGFCCAILVTASIAMLPLTPICFVYTVLMIMGSWIIPVATSYIPHDPHGENELLQTRMFRGRVASIIAVEHLYHLEHHLYPSIPHHHWPTLAKRPVDQWHGRLRQLSYVSRLRILGFMARRGDPCAAADLRNRNVQVDWHPATGTVGSHAPAAGMDRHVALLVWIRPRLAVIDVGVPDSGRIDHHDRRDDDCIRAAGLGIHEFVCG